LAGDFTCSVCGQEHPGLPADWAYKLPDDVWEIPEPERQERAFFNDDFCQFGERFFIRCVLEVPFVDQDGAFAWGVWAEVDWAVFERYWKTFEEDGSSEPMRSGSLANALAPYPDISGSPVLIRFRDATKRPSLNLHADDDSILANEQRRGIDGTRHHDILACLGYQG
jgi:hypothetical protein